MSEPNPTTPPRRDRLADRAVEREVERRGDRLDPPLASRRRLITRPKMDPDAFGHFAESFARFMGTARFLGYMTVFVLIWIAWNFVAPAHKDGYSDELDACDENGHFPVPQGPGLGVEYDWDFITRHRTGLEVYD